MELKPQYDILVPGLYFCDVIFTGLPGFPALGTEIFAKQLNVVTGGVLNTVFAMQRLGLRVGWIGAIGSDFFSQFALQQARLEGADISLVEQLPHPLKSVTVSLSYPADRAFISYVDPEPDSISLLLDRMQRVTCKHLHFPSLEIDERIPTLIDQCHDRGITVSMDCQHRDEGIDHPLVRDILSRVNLFMPNAIEAQRLTRAGSLEQAITALSEIVSTLVIKNGAEGALAWREGVLHRAPALPVNAVETTGAGDVFNSGFLAAYLEGSDTDTCLRWGNYCGGMSTLSPGGTMSAPTRAQLDQWLEQQGKV